MTEERLWGKVRGMGNQGEKAEMHRNVQLVVDPELCRKLWMKVAPSLVRSPIGVSTSCHSLGDRQTGQLESEEMGTPM